MIAEAWPQPARGLVHEKQAGDSVDWYTPIEFFEQLGMRFDLDPCAGSDWRNVVPATIFMTKEDDGLSQPWHGRVFVNPPYGPLVPKFLRKLREHGNGIALVFARTETRWAQEFMKAADAVVLMSDRLYFVREDGFKGRAGCGSMLLVFGRENVAPVRAAKFGWMIEK